MSLSVVGVGQFPPAPLLSPEILIISAWSEIGGQFTQGSSFLPGNLRVTLFFEDNMITTTFDQCVMDLQVATMDAFDQYFSQPLLSFIWALIPTRTGKLADLIMQSIIIYRLSNSRTFIFNIPQGYPPAITNPKHNGEIGYGPKYQPTYTSPLIQKVRDTPKGAYYLLSDPIAEPNYLVTIQNYIYGLMYQLIAYMDAVKFTAFAWIEQKKENLSLEGYTTTKKQTFQHWNTSEIGKAGKYLLYVGDRPVPNLEQSVVAKGLWKEASAWVGQGVTKSVGYADDITSLGMIALHTKRLYNYKWYFMYKFENITTTKLTLGK